jgi:hypothetical protein
MSTFSQLPIPTAPTSAIQMPELPQINTVAMPEQKGGGMGAGALGAIGQGAGSIIDALTPQEKVNQEFMSRNQNIQKQLDTTSQLTSGISNAAMATGNPFAMAGALAMKGGSALAKGATDKFGVTKEGFGNKLKHIAGATLNPVELIGLLNQGDREKSKNRFVNTEVASKTSQNQELGNVISNSLPQYQAPSYGRQGLKLISKFSK